MPPPRSTVTALAVILAGWLVLASARPVEAQAALPYIAYGVGLQPGQAVEARVAGTPVGEVSADRAGRWKMQIEPGPHVANGAVLAFFVDGTATGVTVVFQSGRFPSPPGIALASGGPTPSSASPAATPVPAPRATPSAPRPTPRPTATPRPKTLCTKGGRPAACQPFTIAPRP